MKINNLNFNSLVNNLSSIQIELNYENNSGHAEIEDYEIISGKYILFLNFNIYETISVDEGDYFTPPEITSESLSIEDISFVITHKGKEGSIWLTELQKSELINIIESLISTTI